MSNVYARFMIPAFFLMTFVFGEITEDTVPGRIVASAAEEVTASFLQSTQAAGATTGTQNGYQVDPSNPMSIQIGELTKAATPNPLDLVNPLGYIKDVFTEVADVFESIGTTIENTGNY